MTLQQVMPLIMADASSLTENIASDSRADGYAGRPSGSGNRSHDVR
jgi:hypothetical protein